MNNTVDRRALVLGATGKTGSRVASKLPGQGVSVRTAARKGADVHFDWNNPATFKGALHDVTGVYLVSPVMRTDFAGVVSDFLDQAGQAGVQHVTYLSAYGMEHAPAEVALRAVELDLESRSSLDRSVTTAWIGSSTVAGRGSTGGSASTSPLPMSPAKRYAPHGNTALR